MRFLQGSEVKKQIALYAVFSLIAIIAGFAISPKCGIFAVILSAASVILHFAITCRRYKELSRLSKDIDKILHGANLSLEEYREGELSILESEINKLTTKLRDQSSLLNKEKIALADSIADISHQIRTPLTSINLIVEIMQNPDTTPEKQKECIKKIKQLLSKIDFLISELLKIARIDAGTVKFESKRVEFSDLIRAAVNPVAIPLELKEQEVVCDISGGFSGDIGWTAEAVTNILKNCSEHMTSGGKIYITASENPIFSEIFIHDTGCGIRAEDLSHLFERFYKGKNSGEQSVGIGLALARMIITRQNGTVKAENHKDGGAAFTIKFFKSTV